MPVTSKDEKDIFLAVLQETGARRQACLEDACAGDPALLKRVELLLSAHLEAQGPLDSPPPGIETNALSQNHATEGPGTVIGPYKLLEQIGEGGMGLVFVAEQQKPVRRRVALKIIKPGMDSRQVIARFEAERQALALMDHPNIAKILDGGTTGDKDEGRRMKDEKERSHSDSSFILPPSSFSGRPYFVMELVKGKPITEYCDRNQLGTRQRLELFLSVCHAVQHAHQKGIIHRDLKPSNILVEIHDVRPVVKIIDFGIAKAIGQQLTDKTMYTAMAQMIGTPLYMSPEQAGLSSLDVDTRSDVYALGVLLYELLTGTTPFDNETLKKAGYDEMRRIIREDEPAKPSARLSTLHQEALSTIANQRGLEPRKLGQQIRGELDWIVMRALEKDRNRRYESASAFAADVQRYLQDEPVEACPPTTAYKLKKFARRNKAALTFAAVLLAALTAVLATLGWNAHEKSARLTLAQQAVAKDLAEADVWQKQEQWAKALQALERALSRLDADAPDSLRSEVEERRRDASFVVKLQKIPLQIVDVGGPDIAGADQAYGLAFKENGLNIEEITTQEMARRIKAMAVNIHVARALDYWAYCKDQGPNKNGQALRTLAEFVDDDPLRKQMRDPVLIHDRAALEKLAESKELRSQPPESFLILANLLVEKKSVQAAEQLLRLGQRIHPTNFMLNYMLGYLLGYTQGADQKKAKDAIGFARAAIVLNPESPAAYLSLANAIGNAAEDWLNDESDWAGNRALELNPNYAHAYNHWGNGFGQLKKYPEAEAAFRKAIKLKPDFAKAYHNLGLILFKQKRLPEAEWAFRKTIELKPDFGPAYSNLGLALAHQQRPSEAVAFFRIAVELSDRDYLSLYNAACVAALAAFDRNKDAATLDDNERAPLRGQALDWLRANLAAMRKELEKEPAKAGPLVQQKMRHWKEDSDFNGVRGDEALAKLPEAERQEWQKLWEEVAALEKRAGEKR